MDFGTGLCFPELSSKGKNVPDVDAGRGLRTEQSPSHAKELGGAREMGEAKKKQIPKGWTLLGTVPLILGKGTASSSWSMPSLGPYLNRKGNYECLMSPVPPSTHHPSLFPPAALTSILGQLGDL